MRERKVREGEREDIAKGGSGGGSVEGGDEVGE